MKFNIRDMHDTRTVSAVFAVAVLVLGALPWVTLTHPFGTLSASAYGSDGLIPLLVVVPVAIVGWFRFRRATGLLVVGYIVVQIVTFGYDYSEVAGEDMVALSPGAGLILSGLLAVAVAAWLLVVERKFAQAKSFETVVSG
jgi:hypothetical protein